MSASGEIISRVEEVIRPILEARGGELVDVQFRRESLGWVLRFFIDLPGGVTLRDCEEVSHEVSTALDVEDIISYPYHLEVSSPGLNRPLKKERDFLRFKGRRVRVKTSLSFQGQRNFQGELLGLEGDKVRISCAQGEVSIPLKAIANAHLDLEV